ncbi:MAG: hypothetical protein JW932_00480 [Deltaproteobacteria bacterium]|nr:hypothetical protein [Deltaproteobacteria bacterium]
MKTMNTLLFIGVFIVSISLDLFIQPLYADDEENLKLKQKITELENRIEYLETLLKVYRGPSETPSDPGYGWENTKNWRKLEVGMKESQVLSILGEPIKLIKGVRTLWYYPSIYRGYVSFDEKGSLTGWMEP